MRPAVFTAVLLLVGIINTVTALPLVDPFKERWDLFENNPSTQCAEDGWVRYAGSRCLSYVSKKKNFQDAQAHCEALDSDLMSIHNEDEMNNAKCLSMLCGIGMRLPSFWIGAHRSGAGFMYTDGTEFKYTNWYPNEPNNYGGHEDCVEINAGEWGKWNDDRCFVKKDFVCVKRK